MVLIYVTGTCLGFQILLGVLVGYIATTFGASTDFTSSMLFRACINIPFAIFILIPLAVKRDMSSLAFASMVSLCSLTYTTILLFVELPWYNREYRAMPNFENKAFIIDYNFPTACAMTFFAYTC